MWWSRRPACLWAVLPLYFRGRDARSSQAGGPRHYFSDTLSGLTEGACTLVRRLSLDLVPCFINTTTFAARDFWPRLDASDAHTLQGSVRSEQRRLGQKEPPPGGLRRIWLLALLLLGQRALAAMLPRRASPEAKCGATNVDVFMKRGTKQIPGRAGRLTEFDGSGSG